MSLESTEKQFFFFSSSFSLFFHDYVGESLIIRRMDA